MDRGRKSIDSSKIKKWAKKLFTGLEKKFFFFMYKFPYTGIDKLRRH